MTCRACEMQPLGHTNMNAVFLSCCMKWEFPGNAAISVKHHKIPPREGKPGEVQQDDGSCIPLLVFQSVQAGFC